MKYRLINLLKKPKAEIYQIMRRHLVWKKSKKLFYTLQSSHIFQVRYRIARAVLFFVILCFFTINISQLQFTTECLEKSLEGPIPEYDKELLQYIRNKFLQPPSISPYNTGIYRQRTERNSELFYKKYIKELFYNNKNGFFIEAGALDGEIMSNTLWLEKQNNWTGLLVEPDPVTFIKLKNKNRKAWTANVCLSFYPYPAKERLSSVDYMNGVNKEEAVLNKAQGQLLKKEDHLETETMNTFYYYSQCLPLNSILEAMKVTQVDLLSLDIEHGEKFVIRNLDFKKFNIQVIFLEWWDNENFIWLINFMQGKGYEVVENILADIVFVKKGSNYETMMEDRIKNRKLVTFKFSPNDTGRAPIIYKEV